LFAFLPLLAYNHEHTHTHTHTHTHIHTHTHTHTHRSRSMTAGRASGRKRSHAGSRNSLRRSKSSHAFRRLVPCIFRVVLSCLLVALSLCFLALCLFSFPLATYFSLPAFCLLSLAPRLLLLASRLFSTAPHPSPRYRRHGRASWNVYGPSKRWMRMWTKTMTRTIATPKSR
jgi:hypothetical protein